MNTSLLSTMLVLWGITNYISSSAGSIEHYTPPDRREQYAQANYHPVQNAQPQNRQPDFNRNIQEYNNVIEHYDGHIPKNIPFEKQKETLAKLKDRKAQLENELKYKGMGQMGPDAIDEIKQKLSAVEAEILLTSTKTGPVPVASQAAEIADQSFADAIGFGHSNWRTDNVLSEAHNAFYSMMADTQCVKECVQKQSNHLLTREKTTLAQMGDKRMYKPDISQPSTYVYYYNKEGVLKNGPVEIEYLQKLKNMGLLKQGDANGNHMDSLFIVKHDSPTGNKTGLLSGAPDTDTSNLDMVRALSKKKCWEQ